MSTAVSGSVSGPPTRFRSVVLADLDSFFAAVEIALRPGLSEVPCAVASGQRGVVVSASYRARAHGVHAGMPVAEASRLCPGLRVLPARAQAYRWVSRDLFSRVRAAGGTLEQVSIDEVFWDVTGLSSPRWDVPGDREGAGAARWLRALAASQFSLPVSVGLAGSKSAAKVACSLGKPDGLTVVPLGLDAEFLAQLPVSSVPGVGPVAARALADAGVVTCADALSAPRMSLKRAVGARMSERLLAVVSGRDVEAVQPPALAKSLSAEVTAPQDAVGPQQCGELFSQALAQVLSRLSQSALAARTVTVAHRSAARVDRSASASLAVPSDDPVLLSQVATRLHEKLGSARLRLAGVTLSGLSRDVQLALGEMPRPSVPPSGVEGAPLGEVAYRGLVFEHALFGSGVVQSLSPAGVAVGFSGRVRLLDPGYGPVLPPVAAVPGEG